MTDHVYAVAHKRVRRLYRSARNHSCSFCMMAAQEWALDWQHNEISTDGEGRAYSNNPQAYEPLCVECHRAYDTFVRKNGPDPLGILRLGVRRCEAIAPETRTAMQPHLLGTFRATQLWLNGACDMVYTRVNTFAGSEPVRAPEPGPDWFAELFDLDDAGTVLGVAAHCAYRDWAGGRSLPTRRSFYEALEEHGVTRKRSGTGIVLRGLRLRAPA